MRVLISVTHLLGVGHLARAAALGRAFARAGHAVTLVSGGRPAPNVSTVGISLVQLPSLHVEGTDFKTLFDTAGAVSGDRVFTDRKAMLLETLARVRPDAVIVELFPFGRRQLAEEHMKLCIGVHGGHGRNDETPHGIPLEGTFATPDPCFVACSVRDVLNPPSKKTKAIFAEETLARWFDGVLVHGDPAVLGLDSSWPVSPGLERQLIYTGYVRDSESKGDRIAVESGVSDAGSTAVSMRVGSPIVGTADDGREREGRAEAGKASGSADGPAPQPAPPLRKPREGTTQPAIAGSEPGPIGAAPEILVSGGGSTASLPLMRAATEAAALDLERPWRLLIGHGVSATDFEALVAAAPANAVVERARNDFTALLAACACSVSQLGYNTALDLAATGRPAVVVPFDAGNEVEQVIRAEKFADMGLVRVVRAADLSGETLLAAVETAIAGDEFGGSQRKQAPRLAMDGAERTVRLVEAGVARKRQEASLWRDIGRDLDALAGQGRELRFWWRDDDAVAPSPALDHLLELRRRLDVPLSLAVIPEKASPELAAHIESEHGVDVLVHGIAHRNNAAPDAKKQELTEVSEVVVQSLRQGRMRLEAMFAERALPILVPPWNRIAQGLVSRLDEAGFVGFSTFGSADSTRVIRQVNTHLDPIDWRGGGGLVRAPAHIASLAAMIGHRLRSGIPEIEPVGLLTHHLVHDPWIWAFVEGLIARLKAHRSVRFVSAAELFGLT